MRPTSRRGFLAGTAAALAVPAALRFGSSVNAAPLGQPIGRTRPSHLKLSIAAYSYRDYLVGSNGNKPKIDLFDFLNLAADMGVDAVELTSYYFPEGFDAEFVHRLKVHAFKLGLDVSGTSVGNNFCLPEGPERDKTIQLVKTWVDNAVLMGAPVIRVFAGTRAKGDTEEQAIERCLAGFKATLPYAESKGVMLALENHGGITATPEQLLRLVKAVDSPNFGVNLDTGNFHGDDPYADLAQLAPYAVNVQVKTEISRKGKPKEDADLSKVIGVLKDARYSGYVVLEYEAKPDPFKAIPGIIKSMRGLL